MKKRVLKGWIENLLIIVNVLAFAVMISEVKNTWVFIISKVIAIAIMCINSIILEKYGRR